MTTFQVKPKRSGSLVRIETVTSSSGIRGAIERLLAPRILRRLYNQELDRLDRYAHEQAAQRRRQR